jgi:hypothetical protein
MSAGTRLGATLALALAAPSVARAQTNAPTPTPAPNATASAAAPTVGPPIRRIESAAAVSTEPFGAITSVRALADGRVLVNDGTRRRLLLMDSALTTLGVVLDSLTEVENAYGTRSGALIPYRGDSTLFVDAATYAMLVIDPAGKIARVRSVPRAQDVNWYANPSGSTGLPGIDARGRLVYRIPAQPARPTVPPPPNVPYIPSPPDSAFVVGIHLDTRKVDTLAAVRTTRVVTTVRQTSDGINVFQTANPLPLLDDWAVLPDGTLALVRGRDYRIEWLDSAGTVTSSEKLPFPWVRLTDEDKTRFIDSITTQQTRSAQNNFTTQMIVWSNLLNKPYPAAFVPAPNYVPQQGFPRDWILPKGVAFPAKYSYGCPPGVTPTPPNGTPNAPPGAAAGEPPCIANPYGDYFTGGYQPPAPTYRPPSIVRPSELPDYKPPFAASAVRADAEGNLWIRTLPMKPTPGGPVYDVVSRAGQLVDRVQLPSGYTLVGFGRGNTVYLSMRDAKGLHLARVQLRQVGA